MSEANVAWRQVLADLKDGKIVDIPVEDGADSEKKQAQLEKRASRHGFQVEATPTDGMLRAKRTSEVGDPAPDIAERHEKRAARREEREAARAAHTEGSTGTPPASPSSSSSS